MPPAAPVLSRLNRHTWLPSYLCLFFVVPVGGQMLLFGSAHRLIYPPSPFPLEPLAALAYFSEPSWVSCSAAALQRIKWDGCGYPIPRLRAVMLRQLHTAAMAGLEWAALLLCCSAALLLYLLGSNAIRHATFSMMQSPAILTSGPTRRPGWLKEQGPTCGT